MSAESLTYQPNTSFIRVATACPEVAVGNVAANATRLREQYDDAARQQTSVVVFPELSLTGYTLGDLVQQKLVLEQAKQHLSELAAHTQERETAMVVGLPFQVGNNLYNCAAVLAKGKVQGMVPKAHLPGQNEFYEPRWFTPWSGETTEVAVGDQQVPFGTDLLFQVGDAKMGVEICEDLWVTNPPSTKLAEGGATIIANPSASPEQVGKSDYRRNLVAMQSGRLVLAYLYAGCDASESTTDIVMGGHQIVAEKGRVLEEREPLAIGQVLTIADIDLDHLQHDRRKDGNFPDRPLPTIDCGIRSEQTDLRRDIDPHPFIPTGPEAPRHLQRILDIQAQGLATRMKNTGIERVVLGLSGGLDSTLALLAAVRAAARLGKAPSEVIQTITMPGEASSEHTQSNAVKLAEALGIQNEVIPIGTLAQAELKALGHDGKTQDVTYENVQARLRTSILFNRSNQTHSMVLGTGDLSEIALGWCTYNGDHMSHYNVNASIPKTLVKHLVAFAAEQHDEQVQTILQDILDTPISPELTKEQDGAISQQTETIIGPYELHDFFLYHFMRNGDTPDKIAYLAAQAFKEQYALKEIMDWLGVFMARFMRNQWKRSVATDGPKVGSVCLSPRGDWRMPSDMSGTMWQSTLQ